MELFDEGSGEHPADFEDTAYAPAGLVGKERQLVSLSAVSPELRERLLPYKIYDGLPWEEESPLMLEKWRQFVSSACAPENAQTRYVFNCVLLQNPLCETMMRFGYPQSVSQAYIQQIAESILPLSPVVVYLHNTCIARAIQKEATHRPGWLEAVIPYHTQGAYGKSIGAVGFDGYVRCLVERQKRELSILKGLPLTHYILTDPQKDWQGAMEQLRRWIL